MKEETREQLLSQTLHEYAERAIPDKLDGWPAIEGRLLTTHPSLAWNETPETMQNRPIVRAGIRAGRGINISFAAALVVVLAISAASLAFLAGWPPTGQGATAFVPAGQVRHVVMRITWSDPTLSPRTDEVWYGNGKNHLLMYIVRGGLQNGDAAFVDEDAIYEYQPGAGGTGGEVDKYPYTPRYLSFYGPIPDRSGLLSSPDVHVIGNQTLNGRPVVEVENADIQREVQMQSPLPFSFKSGQALPTPEPPSTSRRTVLEDVHRWIDINTGQILKAVITWTDMSGPNSGDRQSQTLEVATDELRDASAFPLGTFTFKIPQGATLIEKSYPPDATPAPTETASK